MLGRLGKHGVTSPEETRYPWDDGADERVESVFIAGSSDLIIRYDNGQLCVYRRKETSR